MNTRKHKAGRSKQAKAQTLLNSQQMFFYEHASYSSNPKTQTAEQGRIECAKALADAETFAIGQDYEFSWQDDWSLGCSHFEFYGTSYGEREPNTCESCVLKDRDGKVLASLGCIDDADANYRRVIEAELASEALAAHDKEIETLDGGV